MLFNEHFEKFCDTRVLRALYMSRDRVVIPILGHYMNTINQIVD